uniref:ankyrin repeat domain-containing protein 27-like isoform X2 n=1 Tax=Ciona intestinalis TaxID=7719 RepID=UPI000521C571|nr:ankyrin repeat domain-containing protein 27-like isoform X2 [Ciona intestinalis]|eukprot:XP_002123303.2 ankyrin repeat domain-containing protein 27-like isoform X2 [Ciona intestinalis]
MSAYDEDLTENGWYLALSQKHEDLFIRATNERWMICIPRVGSWKGGIEDGDLFSQKSFESHILKQLVVYGDKPEVESNKYLTYNGKEVFITGPTVTCGEGFTNNFNIPSYDKRSERLELHIETSHTSQILFEETFFNQHDESYVVLCLSQPLEQHLVSVGDEESSSSEVEKASGPRWESYGSYVWTRAYHGKRLHHFIDERITHFVSERKYPCNYEVRSLKSSDELVVEAKVVAECAEKFITSMVQNVIKDSKLKKYIEVPSQQTALYSSLESYILHGTYVVNMRELNDIMSVQDEQLNKITRNLSSVKYDDLEIKEELCTGIPRARRELSMMNRFRTPGEKLECLENTIRFLSPRTSQATLQINANDRSEATNKNEPIVMSSDDLLPILIYLVLKCEITNWLANLMYMKYFYFTKTNKDQHSFYLATLEAAVEHVRNRNIKIDRTKLSALSSHEQTQELHHLFKLIENVDVAGVDRLLRQAQDMKSLHDHDKCHPLCECNNCTKLSNRKANRGSYVSVSSRDDRGRTALHIAAVTGKHEVVDTLLNHGSDINASDYHGATPLHLAAQEGSQSVIFLLLHHEAAANAVDNNNNTPLHLACYGGHDGSVKAMLFYDPVRAVVKVDAVNDQGDIPLHIASRWGYASIAQALVECGSDISCQNRKKESPLDVAHNSQMKYILQHTELTVTYSNLRPEHTVPVVNKTKHSNINQLTQKINQSNALKPKSSNLIGQFKREKPSLPKQILKLHRAVTDNDVHMVAYMCGWGLDDDRSCDPLCQCYKCQPSQDIILHANSTSPDGSTPLLISCMRGYVEMTRMLLDHDARVGCKSKDRELSPLHLACQYGYEEIVRLLLDHGAVCDVRNAEGNTPIYMCAANGHASCAEVLLEFGASVNIRNHKYDAPLHEAVKWRNINVATLLMESGAMTYYKNKQGITPLQMAKENPEMYAVLTSAPRDHDVTETTQPETQPQPIKCHRYKKSISQSEADEMLANDLFERFTPDPAPTTPPLPAPTTPSSSNPIFTFHDNVPVTPPIHMKQSCDEIAGTGFYKPDADPKKVTSDVTDDIRGSKAEIKNNSDVKHDVIDSTEVHSGSDNLKVPGDTLESHNVTTPSTSSYNPYFEIGSRNSNNNENSDLTNKTHSNDDVIKPDRDEVTSYLSLHETS